MCECVLCNQAGQNRSIQRIYEVDLSASAQAILRRNRGIHAAKEIQECKKTELDLSDRYLGDEGVTECIPALTVHVTTFVCVSFDLLCGLPYTW